MLGDADGLRPQMKNEQEAQVETESNRVQTNMKVIMTKNYSLAILLVPH